MIPLSLVLENHMKQPTKIFEVVHFSLNTLHILTRTARTGSSCFEERSNFKTSMKRGSEKCYVGQCRYNCLLETCSLSASPFIANIFRAHHFCLNNHLLRVCLSVFPQEVGGHSFQELLEAKLQYSKEEVTTSEFWLKGI